MTRRDRQRLERLLAAAPVMLQGSLSRTTRTCGRPTCRCHRGQRHGPHTYLTFRTPDGRSRARYVRPAEVRRVQQGVRAWARFWAAATQLAAANRAALGRRRRGGRAPEGRHAR